MIIYNVTVKTDRSIATDWLRWMKQEHIPQLLATGCFTACRLFRLLEQDDTEGPTYCVQYSCEDITQYHRYVEEYAAVMRDRSAALWGNRFAAFRSVMSEEA